MSNPYCDVLKIKVPSLKAVKHHREASPFTLMLVALLERGESMTLLEVATEFERAGVAAADDALRSLKRCRPGRPPVYRNGDDYELDPYDKELDLWAFRLGLRPSKVPVLRLVPPAPEPIPGPEIPLRPTEVEEAMSNAYLTSWSSQRLALAILDSQGGRMAATEVVRAVDRLTPHHRLSKEASRYWRRGSAITELEGGVWEMQTDHPALRSAREAVRQRAEKARHRQAIQPDLQAIEIGQRRYAVQKAAHAKELANLTRVLLHAFPKERPEAIVLLDVTQRELITYSRDAFDTVLTRLADYDVIGAVDVRPLLKTLGFDYGQHRLAELGPPQKSRKLTGRRTLEITTSLLIQSSCGIRKPLADTAALQRYLEKGQIHRLHRRLETDAKALFAFYQYGRLHRAVGLASGSIEEWVPVPWVHPDEPMLYDLKEQAFQNGQVIDVVFGSAPAWENPWERATRCTVAPDGAYRYWLVDEDGAIIDDCDVQLARLVPL